MCGIAALVGQAPPEVQAGIVRTMTDLVHHRGPDAAGMRILLDGALALGHARLSIIDLAERANQPMTYRDSGLWLVYNGEVYNYLELKRELEGLGYGFATTSDSEVILAAYHAWGKDCLKRFNGMFAFVIADTRRNLLFAARDRLGVKPLYYYRGPGNTLALASEIKQFTAIPGWRARINPQRLFDFLARGLLDHTHETLFRDVYQLRGGQFLELEIDPSGRRTAAPRIQTWWTLPENTLDPAPSLDEACEAFSGLLEDAVQLRLRADVPIGSCLSGGIDSSSIVCLVNRILGREKSAALQKTFSSCFDDPRFDEREYITAVIEQTRVAPHYTFPDPAELFDVLGPLTWHQDEPFGSTSIFAQWQVFQLARHAGVTVMLDGQGADELLAGYHIFLWAWLADLLRRGNGAGFMRELQAIRKNHGYGVAMMLTQLAYIFLPERIRSLGRALKGQPDIPAWMARRAMQAHAIDPSASLPTPSTSIKDLSREQISATNLPALLHYEDRNSMAHSLEARVPFLDYRLVEYAYCLPDAYKVADGQTKHILRLAMRGIIPEKVRSRQDKMGFVTPEEVWFKDQCAREFRERLMEACTTLDTWVDKKCVETYMLERLNGKRSYDWTLWRIINTAQWIKTFHMTESA